MLNNSPDTSRPYLFQKTERTKIPQWKEYYAKQKQNRKYLNYINQIANLLSIIEDNKLAIIDLPPVNSRQLKEMLNSNAPLDSPDLINWIGEGVAGETVKMLQHEIDRHQINYSNHPPKTHQSLGGDHPSRGSENSVCNKKCSYTQLGGKKDVNNYTINTDMLKSDNLIKVTHTLAEIIIANDPSIRIQVDNQLTKVNIFLSQLVQYLHITDPEDIIRLIDYCIRSDNLFHVLVKCDP